MYGSTRVLENYLRPIARWPRLREWRVQERRTYRPSVADIRAALRD